MDFDTSERLENVNHHFSRLAPGSVYLICCSASTIGPGRRQGKKKKKVKVPPQAKLMKKTAVHTFREP